MSDFAFSAGNVPHGWKRGEPLSVNRAQNDHDLGTIRQHEQPPIAGRLTTTATGVYYLGKDSARVEAWLEWWNG